jgi:hypothetical protein
MPRTWLLPTFLLLAAGMVRADEDPPVGAGDEDYSGARGRYRIETRARPTRLHAEDPLLLTVRITGSGPADYPPRRLDRRLKLIGLDRLRKDFQVEDLPGKDRHPDERTWEFVFRLRPRHEGVRKIPKLGFKYYNPAPQVRNYQTSYAPAIALVVTPRPRATRVEEPLETGNRLGNKYPLITGAAVLERREVAELPAPWLLALLVVLPPGLCLAWWGLWRHYYPDTARAVTLRRSRAARLALKALRAVRPAGDGDETAARSADVVAGYLRQRLDFTAAEPTPFEISVRLEQAGVSSALAGRFGDFFRTCDAARFAPGSLDPQVNLKGQAAALVRQLEAELC